MNEHVNFLLQWKNFQIQNWWIQPFPSFLKLSGTNFISRNTFQLLPDTLSKFP